jgi:hypothetical protein
MALLKALKLPKCRKITQAPVMQQFDRSEIEKLGYYVYVYNDPRNNSPFYVGKGQGNRAFAHLDDNSGSLKGKRIEEIHAAGLRPKIEILAFGLDEPTALKIEAAAIDLIGFENLTNAQIGHHARQFGRRSIDTVHAELSATPVGSFDHNMVLIKISGFNGDASEASAMVLYDATRGTWRVKRASVDKTEYAAAIFGGVIREVYRVAAWLPAESTLYLDPNRNFEPNGRLEFVGKVAENATRDQYRWRSVAHLYSRGAANPIMYVGPAFPKPTEETLD